MRGLLLPVFMVSAIALAGEGGLKNAERLFTEMDYTRALRAAEEVLRSPGVGPEELVAAYRLKGLCLATMGMTRDAVVAFAELLSIDPSFCLSDDYAPRQRLPFYRAVHFRQQMGHEPISLSHDSPETAGVLSGLLLLVRLDADPMGMVAGVQVRYRTEERQWEEGGVVVSVEVTQEWFEATMGYNPSNFSSCGDDCPVEMVNWHESAAFCNALSEAEGLATCYTCTGTAPDFSCGLDPAYATPYDCPGYRLPTEAEWEYVARAGTTESTYNGDIDASHLECEEGNTVLEPIAWFCGNSGSRTHEAMTRDPNGLVLYDMLGNVWEWCHDWYVSYSGDEADPWGPAGGSHRVRRGGSWHDRARYCRVARRNDRDPDSRHDDIGLRPSRSN